MTLIVAMNCAPFSPCVPEINGFMSTRYIEHCICILVRLVMESHYTDVIMGVMASQISSLTMFFTQAFILAQIKEHIKALRHWPL